MNRFIFFAATLLMLIATSCGKSDTYIIEGEIVDLGTQNLHLVYIDDDAVHTAQATALDGKFKFEGKLTNTVLMDLYSSAGAPLFTFIVTPGDHITCRLNLDNPADDTIKGSDMTARLIEQTAKPLTNDAIDTYVAANTDDPVSSVLVTRFYDAPASDPSHIDSIISMIHPDARIQAAVIPYATLLRPLTRRLPAKATLYTADADTFVTTPLRGKSRRLIIVNTSDERSATARTHHAHARQLNDDNLTIIEYTLASDTAQWKSALRNDTLPGHRTQAYAPGGLADPLMMQLGVSRHPYYILADTAGLILARDNDLTNILRAL